MPDEQGNHQPGRCFEGQQHQPEQGREQGQHSAAKDTPEPEGLA
jgi:hypothetical protein